MGCFSGISSLSRCEILALANALSVALSEGLSAEDLDTLGNLLTAISGIMTTFATIEITPEPPDEKPDIT